MDESKHYVKGKKTDKKVCMIYSYDIVEKSNSNREQISGCQECGQKTVPSSWGIFWDVAGAVNHD